MGVTSVLLQSVNYKNECILLSETDVAVVQKFFDIILVHSIITDVNWIERSEPESDK